MSLPTQAQEAIERAKEIESEITNPKPEQEPENKQEPVEEPKPKVDPEDYKERYSRFKKHADQEIYNLRQTVKANESTINILTEKVKELESKAAEYDALQSSSIKEKLGEELGEDTANILNDYIEKVVSPLQSENELLKAKLESLEEVTVSQIEQANNTETINRIMSAIGPDIFNTVDRDPTFIEYLDSIDPISNKPIKDLIQSAISTNNLSYVVTVYRDFYNTKYNNPYDKAINNLNQQQQPNNDILEQRVQPTSNAGTTPDQSQAEKKIWRRAEIKQFYIDKTQGKIDPEVAKKISADIEDAALEGRIVG